MKTSVVIATYNGEKYIEEQLKSIILQTVKPDEIVICDDHSKDETIKIINALLSKTQMDYKIIRHKNNLGVVKSFKDALLASSGDLVFLCDQDDVWKKEKIEKFIKIFKDNDDCILVFSNASVTDDKLCSKGTSLWESIHFNPEGMRNFTKSAYISELLKRNIFTGMCMAFKRELIDAETSFSTNMLHDEFLGWRALFKGKIVPINEQLVYYRQHSKNVVGNSKIRKFQSVPLLKAYVRKSSIKTFNKLNELIKQPYDDDPIILMLKDALEFYSKRIQLYEMKMIPALRQILILVWKDGYKRYTSKTEKALIKDLVCIIF